MIEVKPWTVVITNIETHTYTGIEARTPEEAESIAEGWLEEGSDEGRVSIENVETESYPEESVADATGYTEVRE